MNRLIAVALLAVGVVLLIVGANAAESFSSEVSEVFTGTPTDRAMWFLIGGGVLAALGLGALFLPSRSVRGP